MEGMKCGHRPGEEGGMNRETDTDVCALSCVRQRAGGKLLPGAGSSAWMACGARDAGWGMRGRAKREAMCLHRVESRRATAGTNTTLKQLYANKNNHQIIFK